MSSSSGFPTTRWTLIERVRDGDPPTREKALQELCLAYWLPLYAFARRSGQGPHDAEDAVQGLFLNLLRTGLFNRAGDEPGQLRSLLCLAMKRHLSRTRRRDGALKRGGGAVHVPLLPEDAEQRFQVLAAQDPSSPDVLFHRQWARNVISRATSQLRAYYDGKGKSALFESLVPFLPVNDPVETHEVAAERLGMSPNAFHIALFRMRQRLKESIRREVRETIHSHDPRHIEAEIQDLLKALET